ncbi:DUF6440 family protein [Priestia aryabhattai]|uniref:DUF6440 family protein n=1 Tax=Priestia aryabhattai TaxID=412384 RepID=UPI002E1D5CB9|nr:DUF6440 family protein [Priestia aryabhattai]
MKKLLVLSALTISLTSLAGCQSDTNDRFTDLERGSKRFSISTDKDTNCKYLVYARGNKSGITPLLTSDVMPDCSK